MKGIKQREEIGSSIGCHDTNDMFLQENIKTSIRNGKHIK